MDWLSSWLKEVILVVMLATFIDLLMPSRSMERYIKLVLSLIILLTLLGPLVKLLIDSPMDKLSATMSMQEYQSGSSSSGGNSLQRIMTEAENLKHQQQQQSLKWAGDEVAARMKEQVREETGLNPKEVKVALQMQTVSSFTGEQQTPVIASVTVTMPNNSNESNRSSSSSSPAAIDIPAIEPVKVDVDIKLENKGAESAEQPDSDESKQASGQTEQMTGDMSNQAEHIRNMLAAAWNIEPDKIELLIQTGGDAKL